MAMESFVVKAKIVYVDLISICFSCNAGFTDVNVSLASLIHGGNKRLYILKQTYDLPVWPFVTAMHESVNLFCSNPGKVGKN